MKFTDTQINEGKNKVAKIFMDKFYEFIEDLKNTNGTGYDFGRKYGATFHPESVEKHTKNTLTKLVRTIERTNCSGLCRIWRTEKQVKICTKKSEVSLAVSTLI